MGKQHHQKALCQNSWLFYVPNSSLPNVTVVLECGTHILHFTL